MTEKTTVELITEMHEMMVEMKKTMALMNKNINLINDKANGTVFSQVMATDLTALQKKAISDLDSPPQIGVVQPAEEKVEGAAIQKENVKVESKIISSDKKPLRGVVVIITNSAGKVVKKTKSNRAGVWMCHLPPDTYTVKYEYNNSFLRQKTIHVKDDQKELKI